MTAGNKPISISDDLEVLRREIEHAIEECCASSLSGPDSLGDAMSYSLRAGGKRFRPCLSLLTYRACGGQDDREAMAPAIAIECIHTFSLIHDDLPSMDDDDLRRGIPTSHKVFGEDMAILAGDALLALAFELPANTIEDKAILARIVKEFAVSAGPAGLAGGQAMDIRYDQNTENIPRIHSMKTAALIRCSVLTGALAAGITDEDKLSAIGEYGQNLGMAFQIVDDLLDVSGETEDMGKKTGKDADTGKPNLAVAMGVEEARARAEELTHKAKESIGQLDLPIEPLLQLADFVLDRSN